MEKREKAGKKTDKRLNVPVIALVAGYPDRNWASLQRKHCHQVQNQEANHYYPYVVL